MKDIVMKDIVMKDIVMKGNVMKAIVTVPLKGYEHWFFNFTTVCEYIPKLHLKYCKCHS